jgi:hypothetical protein
MKAILINRWGDYRLYVNETPYATIGDSPYKKLSKQNCNDLFGVVDINKFIIEDSKGRTIYHESYELGFQRAMELNNTKHYTLEDMMNCWNKALKFQEHKETLGEHIQSLQQPTEIDVEIVMEKIVDETKMIGAVKGVKGSGDKITTYKSVPKLDSEGCLILKKI